MHFYLSCGFKSNKADLARGIRANTWTFGGLPLWGGPNSTRFAINCLNSTFSDKFWIICYWKCYKTDFSLFSADFSGFGFNPHSRFFCLNSTKLGGPSKISLIWQPRPEYLFGRERPVNSWRLDKSRLFRSSGGGGIQFKSIAGQKSPATNLLAQLFAIVLPPYLKIKWRINPADILVLT